jgi:hypothetical protein
MFPAAEWILLLLPEHSWFLLSRCATLLRDVLLVFYQTSYSRLRFSAVGVFLFP